MSTPFTAGLPSKALKRPFASIAKLVPTVSPSPETVVARGDAQRQATIIARSAGSEGARARLRRVRRGARRCDAPNRRAAQAVAGGRLPRRHDLDGGHRRAA